MEPKSARPKSSGSSNSLIQRSLSKRIFLKFLGKIRIGKILLSDEKECLSFGDESAELNCHIQINTEDANRRIVKGGGVGAGEAYILGDWDTNDLTKLVRIFLLNRAALEKLRSSTTPLKKIWLSFFHWLNQDTIRGSKKNIVAHYDLGNEFFEKFLDPTLTYSCAEFRSPDETLEKASLNKVDRICQQLALSPSDHLMEIGCGWGAFAIHAAEKYGCRVTTTTISEEQYKYVEKLISKKGLQNQITLLNKDYRELEGEFDKLVSIEMVEAVGLNNLPGFFRRCSSLLSEDGIMVLQAITMEEQRFKRASESVDFIQRYIFPGGALPSLTGLASIATESTDLRPLEVKDITLHYSETLKRWREKFNQNVSEIAAIGFDRKFQRMWDYYLAYCEGAFMERAIGCVQMQFHKPFFRGQLK